MACININNKTEINFVTKNKNKLPDLSIKEIEEGRFFVAIPPDDYGKYLFIKDSRDPNVILSISRLGDWWSWGTFREVEYVNPVIAVPILN